MDRRSLLIIVLAVCVTNGLFSPFLAIALPITAALMPGVIPWSGQWVLFFSVVSVSTATLLFSGVPAALYERMSGKGSGDLISMYIWLGVATLMTLPALQTISRL